MRNAGAYGLLSLLSLALVGCKQGGSEQASASAAPPSAQPAAAAVDSVSPARASAPAEAPAVKIPERAVGSGWTKDSMRFVQAFKFVLPESAPSGASFKDARTACDAVGKDLCSEDQWELACATDESVAKVASWTITPAGASGWRVRGGGSCDQRVDSADDAAADGRVGLCCERRAAISTSKNRQESVMKAAQTYIEIVEKASNSGSPAEVTRLLADEAKLFKTTMSRADAEKDLASDWKRWPKQNVRLFRCDADAAGENGGFECDAVGARTAAESGESELGVFHVRFEYRKHKYTVFAEPTSITRKWAPY